MLYRLKTSLIFNHRVDLILNNLLKLELKYGIKSINSVNKFKVKVIFNSDTEYIFWNKNKYYDWLSEGTFKFSNGRIYEYTDARPTAKTMYLFMKLLSKSKY